MKKTILVMAAPLALFACDEIQKPMQSEQVEQIAVNQKFELDCKGDKDYDVMFTSADKMVINYGGSQTLTRVVSASGEKYENKYLEVWLSGNEAMITEVNGNTIACEIDL